MPKYIVTLCEERWYYADVEIEAASRDEASEKAMEEGEQADLDWSWDDGRGIEVIQIKCDNDDCDDPEDSSETKAIKQWLAKRWLIKLYPKAGVECDVSILARDLSHTDAVRLMTDHNDGPYPTWARMEEDVDAEV